MLDNSGNTRAGWIKQKVGSEIYQTESVTPPLTRDFMPGVMQWFSKVDLDEDDEKVPRVSMDYCYLNEEDERNNKNPV